VPRTVVRQPIAPFQQFRATARFRQYRIWSGGSDRLREAALRNPCCRVQAPSGRSVRRRTRSCVHVKGLPHVRETSSVRGTCHRRLSVVGVLVRLPVPVQLPVSIRLRNGGRQVLSGAVLSEPRVPSGRGVGRPFDVLD
jgi:hypothetical protein